MNWKYRNRSDFGNGVKLWVLLCTQYFLLPREAMLSAVFAVVMCLCVCLSVCPSHSGIVSKRLNPP